MVLCELYEDDEVGEGGGEEGGDEGAVHGEESAGGDGGARGQPLDAQLAGLGNSLNFPSPSPSYPRRPLSPS